MKTALILLVICLVSGWVILRAVRAMKQQISNDRDDAGDWAGAKRYGGKFDADTPPADDEVRRTWTPVRAPTAGALAKPNATGAAGMVGETQLRKYVKWCDARCRSGWLIVLPVDGAPTLWFRNTEDAQDFARSWHPLAGT